MLEVKNLTKRYGAKYAVNDISFTVNDGEILGFLGPNGAGKSTTMNILTGYLSSTEGTVTLDGAEILEEPKKVKSQIGYLPELPPLYLDMTVSEYLSFMFDLKNVKQPKQQHIREICEHVMIQDVMPRMIKNLSKGYRQRVGLAQALLGNPKLLILDEPTVGLDPKQIIEIRNLIRELGKKHTVILSSHILSEVQAVCDRIIVINNGTLVADDSPDKLSKTMSGDIHLSLRVDGPEEDVFTLLSGIPSVNKVERLGSKEPGSFDFILEPESGVDVRRELFRRLSEAGFPLLELRGSELSLEEIFLRLTADAEKSVGDGETPAPDSDAAQAADTAETAETDAAKAPASDEEGGIL